MYAFDGFERKCAIAIVDDLTRAGVEVWGLPSYLSDPRGATMPQTQTPPVSVSSDDRLLRHRPLRERAANADHRHSSALPPETLCVAGRAE